jgi:glycosyltransferase involved in cell wall biosynthesis
MITLDDAQTRSGHASHACATEVFIDLTTTAHAIGRSAGSTRVEWQLAQHVAAQEAAAAAAGTQRETAIRFVAWSSDEAAFIELSPETLKTLRDDCALAPGAPRGTRLASAEFTPAAGRRRILLVTGAGWLSNAQYLHELRALRTRLRAELHAVIHDVTHLMFPHWFPEAEAARIGANLIAMMTSADALMVYSDATAADIETVAARLRVDRAPVRRIALGADLPTASSASAVAPITAMPFSHLLGNRPFVLYVSTITFRKNHDFIYQVWRRLAAERGDELPVLLLVGRVSPDQEVLADRIRRDAAVGDHVRILSGVTDDQLASLYTHCAFTVYPSLYEGWGLPVAESLRYGKVCVTSNAASLPESSGGAAPLLDPLDHAAWCAEIRRLVLDPRALADAEARIKAEYRPVSWADAADRVRAAIAIPASARDLIPHIGDSAANEVAWRIAASEGLMPGEDSEDGGTLRATGDRAHLGLLLDGTPPPGVRVSMSLQPLIASESHVEISLSGHLADACPLAAETAQTPRTAAAWRGILNTRGLLDLDFRVTPALSPGATRADRAPFLLKDLRIERLTAEEAAALEDQQHVRWAAGEIVSFGAGTRGPNFLRHGWDAPAPWGVWSVGPEAGLEFTPFSPGGRGLCLRATLRAFVWPQAPALEVEVLADGRHVATWSFDHRNDRQRTERTVTIPAVSAAALRPLNLTFRMPGCRSPRQLGLSADERLLGIALMQAEWLVAAPGGSDPVRTRDER